MILLANNVKINIYHCINKATNKHGLFFGFLSKASPSSVVVGQASRQYGALCRDWLSVLSLIGTLRHSQAYG